MIILSVNQQNIPLVNGRELSQEELPGISPSSADGSVAIVSLSPVNPAVLGLTNLSSSTWQAVLSSGLVKLIEPGRTIRLDSGTKIIFGTYAGTVTSSNGSARKTESSSMAPLPEKDVDVRPPLRSVSSPRDRVDEVGLDVDTHYPVKERLHRFFAELREWFSPY